MIDAAALQKTIGTVIPDASLEICRLPLSRDIHLWLINADYPRQRLPDETVKRLMNEPFYWAFCWASGLVLADYIFSHPESVRGKRVLDFGSGSGVVAIAAAMAGACQVIVCDCDPLALAAARHNELLNRDLLAPAVLDYRSDFYQVRDSVDIILAADVLYDRANLKWLGRFQQKSEAVLLADSRLKNFSFPGYQLLGTFPGTTLPDLDESPEFRQVRLYSAS